MKKTTLIITVLSLLVVAILMISGFRGGITGGAITCNTPYILVGNDCCLDSNDNQICDKDETEPAAEPVEPPREEITIVEEPKEAPKEETTNLATNEFKIKLDESIQFDGKTITLTNLGTSWGDSPVLQAVFNIDGVEKEVLDTKEMELIKGIKVTTLEYLNLENSVIVKLEKLILREGEYLMNTREDKTIKGKTFKLYDVTESEGIKKITLHIGGVDKLILEEGETGTYDGLKITNLYAFPSGYKLERQAIIKVQ